ncbi:hypothetical protein J0S82_002239 [Galemys pyrenaicus]|uniref:Uncharacterized protein n=1 Tax=Galemys pyrenaicus TaxID=202257 RepID=A0A8J6AJ83_GALPY|nr:hypothetical protein J0S82_002239 [Galemys pyrenaicus]
MHRAAGAAKCFSDEESVFARISEDTDAGSGVSAADGTDHTVPIPRTLAPKSPETVSSVLKASTLLGPGLGLLSAPGPSKHLSVILSSLSPKHADDDGNITLVAPGPEARHVQPHPSVGRPRNPERDEYGGAALRRRAAQRQHTQIVGASESAAGTRVRVDGGQQRRSRRLHAGSGNASPAGARLGRSLTKAPKAERQGVGPSGRPGPALQQRVQPSSCCGGCPRMKDLRKSQGHCGSRLACGGHAAAQGPSRPLPTSRCGAVRTGACSRARAPSPRVQAGALRVLASASFTACPAVLFRPHGRASGTSAAGDTSPAQPCGRPWPSPVLLLLPLPHPRHRTGSVDSGVCLDPVPGQGREGPRAAWVVGTRTETVGRQRLQASSGHLRASPKLCAQPEERAFAARVVLPGPSCCPGVRLCRGPAVRSSAPSTRCRCRGRLGEAVLPAMQFRRHQAGATRRPRRSGPQTGLEAGRRASRAGSPASGSHSSPLTPPPGPGKRPLSRRGPPQSPLAPPHGLAAQRLRPRSAAPSRDPEGPPQRLQPAPPHGPAPPRGPGPASPPGFSPPRLRDRNLREGSRSGGGRSRKPSARRSPGASRTRPRGSGVRRTRHAGDMALLCYNRGCGQRFDPDANADGEARGSRPGAGLAGGARGRGARGRAGRASRRAGCPAAGAGLRRVRAGPAPGAARDSRGPEASGDGPGCRVSASRAPRAETPAARGQGAAGREGRPRPGRPADWGSAPPEGTRRARASGQFRRFRGLRRGPRPRGTLRTWGRATAGLRVSRSRALRPRPSAPARPGRPVPELRAPFPESLGPLPGPRVSASAPCPDPALLARAVAASPGQDGPAARPHCRVRGRWVLEFNRGEARRLWSPSPRPVKRVNAGAQPALHKPRGHGWVPGRGPESGRGHRESGLELRLLNEAVSRVDTCLGE